MAIAVIRQLMAGAREHFPRDRRGVSALELALLGPMLAFTLLATLDLGGALQQSLLLQQAVRAGALYAVQWPTDTTGITNAISAALPYGMSATVDTPTTSCTCWSSGGGVVGDTCGTTCPSGSAQSYLTLTASKTYSPLLLTFLNSISATNVVRTQ